MGSKKRISSENWATYTTMFILVVQSVSGSSTHRTRCSLRPELLVETITWCAQCPCRDYCEPWLQIVTIALSLRPSNMLLRANAIEYVV